MDWVYTFLALPRVRSFYGAGLRDIRNDGVQLVTNNQPRSVFGRELVTVNFLCCCIDGDGISDFLQHSRHLRKFRYAHLTKPHHSSQAWDICKFVTAIERRVGAHLEELYISMDELRRTTVPSRGSLLGFQRLRTLEFPLEIVMATIMASRNSSSSLPSDSPIAEEATSTKDECDTSKHEHKESESMMINDLIPTTVTILSILTDITDKYIPAVEALFGHFNTWKERARPALREIYLSSHYNINKNYRTQRASILAKTENSDVVLHQNPYEFKSKIDWN